MTILRSEHRAAPLRLRACGPPPARLHPSPSTTAELVRTGRAAPRSDCGRLDVVATR